MTLNTLLLSGQGDSPCRPLLRLSDVDRPVSRYHGSRSQSSEQVGQDEARGFGLHTVNPEIGTAGVVLVAPVQQLEVVRLRVERLSD